MRNTGIFFVLIALLISITYGPSSAYARDCRGNVDCREGEYCKDAGSITSCRDCEKECKGNYLCGFWCWLDNSTSDCGALITLGTCEQGVVIYQHANYEGNSQVLLPGRYDISNISIGNDVLSSLQVPNGWKVILYRHHNFTGDTKIYTSNATYVGNDFNDQTSSIVVED